MEPEEHIDQELVEVTRQLEEAKEEAQTNLSGWQRAQADFANYQKREEGKQREIMEFAKEVAIVKMLPTLDTLGQGLKHAPQNVDETWLKGINATLAQLDKVLEEMGVKKIEITPEVTKFDPNYHEAVRHLPRSAEWEGVIESELQTGYEINGKVIRPSMVVVYSENTVDEMAKRI